MKSVSGTEDIWVLKPSIQDLEKGANYAEITLPWTFNRMMKNRGSRGQQERALNIAKGVVAQETLRKRLEEEGVHAPREEKSYRAEDVFDFQLNFGNGLLDLDVKTVHYYSDYAGTDRESLSPSLIIENSDYSGPDWRRFFPMLVPHTQIGQDKDGYCFAIAASRDPRSDPTQGRTLHRLTALPYGEWQPFFSERRLVQAREEQGKGIFVRLGYEMGEERVLFAQTALQLRLIGEWDGSRYDAEVNLEPGEWSDPIGPLSAVSSLQISHSSFSEMGHRSQIWLATVENALQEPVLNSSRRDTNQQPEDPWPIGRDDFCNLMLPDDYVLYFIGWLLKSDFERACRRYSGWVWPDDSDNPFANQRWCRITERDHKTLERAGFDDCIDPDTGCLNAGWLKTTGRGSGACCYVYPNTYSGGLRETNLYVLPQDLLTMDEMVNYASS